MMVLLAGCTATGPTLGGKDAKLIGMRVPLISDGMIQAVYFTQLDARELRNVFNQYPASITVSPGTHLVTAICEWRSSLSEAPIAKNVRRFRMELGAGQTYQFTSSFEGGGQCQTGFEEVTDQKPEPPVARDGH
ncbi:MAG: hypothetical protein HY273_09305 [Gammaproteobacteria bacterium]|nr:hypothetical protein [Gammaproteobacteria bacterium]